MKLSKILSVFFIVLILGIPCRDIFTYAYFNLEKDFIIATFCINKNKPILKCDGKCYLKQQIEKSHSEEERPIAKEDKRNFHFFLDHSSLITSKAIAVEDSSFIKPDGLRSYLFKPRIFQPPRHS